LNGGVTVN